MNPIYHEPNEPPIGTLIFCMVSASFCNNSICHGVTGTGEDHHTVLGNQLGWLIQFIRKAKVEKNKRFGNKTAMLEKITLLLPLYLSLNRPKNSTSASSRITSHVFLV
jgi:hypothetical protein